MRQPNRRMPVWELWHAASVACRGERRAKAGAEGINRRQFFAPEGDLDVPSGFAKNGDAHVLPYSQAPVADLWEINRWMAAAEKQHFLNFQTLLT